MGCGKKTLFNVPGYSGAEFGFRGVIEPSFPFKSLVSLDLFVLLDLAKRTVLKKNFRREGQKGCLCGA